ncbi:D-beta-hydroxybutyrate dehydrogenase, mitochondrial-like [Penaeus japonicus]|uniref:D-beta-hydroxybutyrate dehydrogenase, mitochondrial-like n=1 Tax=Penaeus japonicus TaxID=27405 RepID=UPI001C70D745|nr:D-beta-hydroxybutyrate dehydrogenase, mitochondrial-like [Penaeus japonicus]
MVLTFDLVPDMLFWGAASLVLAQVAQVVGLTPWYVAFPALWLLTASMWLLRAMLKMSTKGKAVLVTGCDTGIGHALALALQEQGFRVFAGCLQAAAGGSGAEALRQKASGRLHVLQLDVTREKQVQEALQELLEILPEDEVLWGVVNNAGVGGFGQVEWVPLEKYREVADVNLFGLLSVTKAFLPLVRRAGGRVVNLSSVTGSIGRSTLSPYTITKYAVEGLSDCLREEMRAWGVGVSIVQPGNFSAGTKITTPAGVARQGTRMWEAMSEVVKADYGEEFFNHSVELSKKASSTGYQDLTPVLRAVTLALTQRFPRARYRAVDFYYLVKVLCAVHLPEWLFDLVYLSRPPLRRCRGSLCQPKMD